MHIQIFQMAFNSCYPFWRPSVCEKSHFWCFGNQRRTEVGEAGEVEKVKKSKKSWSQRSWRSWWSFHDFKISRFQDFKIQDFNIPIITSSYKFEKMKNTKSMLRNSSMSSTEVELVGFRRYSKIPSVCLYVCMYVCDSCPALTTPTILLIFGMKVGDH